MAKEIIKLHPSWEVTGVTLDYASIAAMKLEDNPVKGTQFLEIWITLHHKDGLDYIECSNPLTGEPAIYYKIEDGKNPLAPEQALGKCDTCGVWYQATSGACTEGGCSGTIVPYDGFTRLDAITTAAGTTIMDKFRDLVLQFCIAEDVPDPNDWPNLAQLLSTKSRSRRRRP